MKRPTPDELQVTTLGQCRFESPLGLSTVLGDGRGNYMSDATRVLADIEYLPDETLDGELSFERAIREGSATAFETLWERESHRLYQLAFRITGSREDGMDA